MSVADLRALLRLDRMPATTRGADRLHFGAWAIVAAVVMLAPAAAAFTVLWVTVGLLAPG